MPAGFISERWPASCRNGGRLQIGIPGPNKSESAGNRGWAYSKTVGRPQVGTQNARATTRPNGFSEDLIRAIIPGKAIQRSNSENRLNLSVSLLIEMGPPPRRAQYADNIREVALSEGSRSAPIGTPLEALNSTLNQSVAGDQPGVPTSVPKHTRRHADAARDG